MCNNSFRVVCGVRCGVTVRPGLARVDVDDGRSGRRDERTRVKLSLGLGVDAVVTRTPSLSFLLC
jgi:hypothetical protein